MAQGDGGQVDWLEELVDAVRSLHDQIIEESGGALGEHTSSLYAVCARPFQTALGEELYPTLWLQAAALFHGIICDHVFTDGNKRSATVASIRILVGSGMVSIDDVVQLRVHLLGEVALATASHGLTVAEVSNWLRRIFDDSLLLDES